MTSISRYTSFANDGLDQDPQGHLVNFSDYEILATALADILNAADACPGFPSAQAAQDTLDMIRGICKTCISKAQ